MPLRAVYRIKLEKKVFATKDREPVAGIVLSTGCGPRAMALERPAEPKDCLRAEINKIVALFYLVLFRLKEAVSVAGWLLHSCSRI